MNSKDKPDDNEGSQGMSLENWHRAGDYMWGDVYGNPKFPDGTLICTSTVKFTGRSELTGCPVIVTRNNTYYLGVPRVVPDTNEM